MSKGNKAKRARNPALYAARDIAIAKADAASAGREYKPLPPPVVRANPEPTTSREYLPGLEPVSPLQAAYNNGGIIGYSKALQTQQQRSSAGAGTTADFRVASEGVGASVGTDPYVAFKEGFQQEYKRPITAEEMNDNGVLVNKLGISNDLFRLLPLDRQMGFDAKRLALLDNTDLGKLMTFNPNVIGSFGTKRLSTFSNDFIQGTVLPYLEKANPAEATNVKTAIGQPKAVLPPAPAVQAPGALPPIKPGATPQSPYSIGGPQLPGRVTSRKALDLYMQLLGLTGPEQRGVNTQNRSAGADFRIASATTTDGGQPPPPEPPQVPPGSPEPPVVSIPTSDGGTVYTDPRTGKPWAFQTPPVNPGTPWATPGQLMPLPSLNDLPPEQKALIAAQISKIYSDMAKDSSGGQSQDLGAQYQKNAYDLLLGQAQLQQNQGQFETTLAQRQAEASGYQGGLPTLQRETSKAQQDLANANYALEAAKSAAQIALSQGNLDEAIRQNSMVNALEQMKVKLQADLGYAESERQDIATGINLGRYQNIELPRYQNIELPGAEQTRAIEAGRYQNIELPGAEQSRQLALANMLSQPGGYLALAAAQGRQVPTGAAALSGLPPSPVLASVLTSGTSGGSTYGGSQAPPLQASVPQGFRPLSPRTQRRMSPSQLQELGVGVNLAGGRAEDYYAESQRQGRSVGKPYNTTYLPASPR